MGVTDETFTIFCPEVRFFFILISNFFGDVQEAPGMLAAIPPLLFFFFFSWRIIVTNERRGVLIPGSYLLPVIINNIYYLCI